MRSSYPFITEGQDFAGDHCGESNAKLPNGWLSNLIGQTRDKKNEFLSDDSDGSESDDRVKLKDSYDYAAKKLLRDVRNSLNKFEKDINDNSAKWLLRILSKHLNKFEKDIKENINDKLGREIIRDLKSQETPAYDVAEGDYQFISTAELHMHRKEVMEAAMEGSHFIVANNGKPVAIIKPFTKCFVPLPFTEEQATKINLLRDITVEKLRKILELLKEISK